MSRSLSGSLYVRNKPRAYTRGSPIKDMGGLPQWRRARKPLRPAAEEGLLGASMSRATARLPFVFRAVVLPLRDFFRLEATGGILLFLAAVVALAWANSPFKHVYRSLLSREIALGVGPFIGRFTVEALINDVLMTIFFFVVGMEIKRELVVGELRTFSRAARPGIAAVGGMALPALLFFAFNAGTPGARGWAIPMATDIAFCIGCLTLLKKRVPHALVIFITALAIFDDMGGILVIALFYGTGLHLGWLLGAASVCAVLFLCNRLEVRRFSVYAALGAALWYLLHHGGIHSTVAGVILGLMIPSRASRPAGEILEALEHHARELLKKPRDAYVDSLELQKLEEQLEDLKPPLDRFVHTLHPWVAFGIMPIFALANSGIDLSGLSLADLRQPVVLGTGLGLFVGKQWGVFAFTLAAVKLRVSSMPGGVSTARLYGVSLVTGIGFTVALFIAGLAYPGDPVLLSQAKLGILLGSLLSGVVGALFLRVLRIPDAVG